MAHAGLPHHAGVFLIVPSDIKPNTWDVLLFGKSMGMGTIQATLPSVKVGYTEQSNLAAQRILLNETIGAPKLFPYCNFAELPYVTFNTRHTSLRVYLMVLPRGHYCTAFNSSIGPDTLSIFLRRFPLRNLRAAKDTYMCKDENGNIVNIPFRTIEAVQQMTKAGYLENMV